MTRWEHLTLTVEHGVNGLQMTTTEGPRYLPTPVQVDASLDGDSVLRQLDELGRKEWELVNVERTEGKQVFLFRIAIPEGASRRWF